MIQEPRSTRPFFVQCSSCHPSDSMSSYLPAILFLTRITLVCQETVQNWSREISYWLCILLISLSDHNINMSLAFLVGILLVLSKYSDYSVAVVVGIELLWELALIGLGSIKQTDVWHFDSSWCVCYETCIASLLGFVLVPSSQTLSSLHFIEILSASVL